MSAADVDAAAAASASGSLAAIPAGSATQEILGPRLFVGMTEAAMVERMNTWGAVRDQALLDLRSDLLGTQVVVASTFEDAQATVLGIVVNYRAEAEALCQHGQFEAQQSASRTIKVAGFAVAIVMLMLLQISTGSLRAAVLVMLNMPLALIGGIAAIYVTEGGGAVSNTLALVGIGGPYTPPVISIASMVGFITLFGIAVRNGILLINHYNHLMEVEGTPLADAIVQGSMERLAPILMTALCAALGLLPLALASGRPGSELLAPLATVTLGGLLTSTFLNLFVVPAGYSLVFGQRPGSTAAERTVPNSQVAGAKRPAQPKES